VSKVDVPPTRKSLIGALQTGGRRDAWSEFHGLYGELILRWCRRGGLGAVEAEDVCQEVYLKLFKGIRGYQIDRGRFHSWLYAVVDRARVDFLRGANRVQLLTDSLLEHLGAHERSARPEESGDRGAGELWGKIVAAVKGQFADHYWQAFCRHKLDGMKARDVAEELGLTENVVYVACNRVMARLREEFQNQGGTSE
jgi:RNA polymerase sigma-70 factor (ECF subfamily)